MNGRSDHRIHVILDGEDYGMRRWVNVPRVGDHVMLMKRTNARIGFAVEKVKPDFFVAKVVQVTWGVAEDDYSATWPDINLHCASREEQGRAEES